MDPWEKLALCVLERAVRDLGIECYREEARSFLLSEWGALVMKGVGIRREAALWRCGLG